MSNEDILKHLLTLVCTVILIISAIAITIAQSTEIVWDKLSYQQKLQARRIYHLGKPYNLGLTLIAIAWNESKLGLYPINIKEQSCGLFHQKLTIYLKQHNLKNTELNKSLVCGNLINNLDLATSQAIEVLLFFKKYYTTRKYNHIYAHMIKSYNSGFKSVAVSNNYYKQVSNNVITLHKYFHTYIHKNVLEGYSINNKNMLDYIIQKHNNNIHNLQ